MSIYLLYPILAAIFPAVFLCAKNVHEVKLKNLFLAISVALFFLTAFFVAAFRILQNLDKAALTAFLAILIFYKIGHYYKKIVKKKIREKLFAKIIYTFFVAQLLLNLGYLFATLEFDLKIINKSLFFIYALLNFVPLAKILNFHLRNKKLSTKSEDSDTKSAKAAAPDIYYIVTDGYPGIKALKDILNFDNTEFYNFLKQKNFNVSEKTFSNYPITNLSICSTLNFDYIQNFFDHSKFESDQDAIHNLYKYHLNNRAAQSLKAHGYKYVHLVNHWEQMYFDNDLNADVEIKSSASTDFIKTFLQKTLIGIYQENIFGAVSRRNMQFLFSQLKNLPEIASPKFVFSHLICPHEPYLFDEFGGKPKMQNEDAANKENISLFLGQIKYLNKMLQEIIDNILAKSPNSIIIIHADHGSEFLLNEKSVKSESGVPVWPSNPSPEMLLEKYNIFSAIYLPQKEVDVYEKFKTPVNIFRFILNKYFGENHDLLDERQYYSNYVEHFSFADVTDKIKRD